MAENHIRIFGHRGCRGKKGIAENTLAAFEVALHSADGIELDVFLTTDGHLVVFHDDTLEKLSSGTGNITDHSLEQLKQLKLREASGSEIYTNDTIPTLEEVLGLVERYRAAHPDDKRLNTFTVCIEIKGLGIAKEVANTIEKRLKHKGWSIGNFEAASFDMASLKDMKQRMPEMKLGVLFAGPDYPWDISEQELSVQLNANRQLFEESAKPTPNNTVNITLNSLTDTAVEMIARVANDGKPRITAWTAGETNPTLLTPADQRELVRKLLQRVGKGGAFITDFPEEMKEILLSS